MVMYGCPEDSWSEMYADMNMHALQVLRTFSEVGESGRTSPSESLECFGLLTAKTLDCFTYTHRTRKTTLQLSFLDFPTQATRRTNFSTTCGILLHQKG